jgi:hypothetical protein
MSTMQKVILALVIAGLVWFMHDINPDFDAHKEMILPDAPLESEIWDELEYKDYFLISFTRADRGTMVSAGLCNYIKVVDEEWGR